MSIQNAITFIANVDKNADLRKACYSCKTKDNLLDMLKDQSMGFTQDEFDEAVNVMLFKCQSYEEADCIKQTEVWFSLFQ